MRGGVESAFMSTTIDRAVAMGYAAGDAARMGIVVEVQQGMVNRGADISWLSQYVERHPLRTSLALLTTLSLVTRGRYPHEAEILFGPLTGIEVRPPSANPPPPHPHLHRPHPHLQHTQPSASVTYNASSATAHPHPHQNVLTASRSFARASTAPWSSSNAASLST